VIQRRSACPSSPRWSLVTAGLEKIASRCATCSGPSARGEEYFSAGQKGSSAMPQQGNPVTSEQIVDWLAWYGQLRRRFEDIALWHERDISHSSGGARDPAGFDILTIICCTRPRSLSTSCSCIPTVRRNWR